MIDLRKKGAKLGYWLLVDLAWPTELKDCLLVYLHLQTDDKEAHNCVILYDSVTARTLGGYRNIDIVLILQAETIHYTELRDQSVPKLSITDVEE